MCNKKIINTFSSPDYFFGVLNSGKIELDEFFLYFDSIKSEKIVELCVHPANKIVNDLNSVKNINKANFYKSKNRINEKNLLLSDEFKNFLSYKKIDLINFSDIG